MSEAGLKVEVIGSDLYKVKLSLAEAIELYEVKSNLFEIPFTNEDLKKMVTFCSSNETVVANRPLSLNIEEFGDSQPMNDVEGVTFLVKRNIKVESSELHSEFINEFVDYFNGWCVKFIKFYGKYLEAAAANQLEEFMKHQ